MSENEVVLTKEQLAQLVESFYLSQDVDHSEINHILTVWIQSPSSITTSFEIIQLSENEKLRFIAACCFHHFIKSNAKLFSNENLLEMANLFGSFIMKNQNRIDEADTKNILISLAEICGIVPQFIEEALKMFPPDIFLILIGFLTEEIADQYFRAQYDMENQIDDIIYQLKNTIYQYLAETPFSLHWAQSFYQFFKFFEKPVYCIPFIDKIQMMSQNQNYFQAFIHIFTEAFTLNFDEDESTYEFNTHLIQIAVSFALNNPNHAAVIWNSAFSTAASFFLSEDRVELTEPVIESFYQSIPTFYDDDTFYSTIQQFASFISIQDILTNYPENLLLKHISTFIEILIGLYNEKRDEKMEKCIDCLNVFANYKYNNQIKEFIFSHPLSPALFLIYSSQIFSLKADSGLRALIFEQTFQLPEVPYEATKFLRKYISEIKDNQSYMQRLIQYNLDLLEPHTFESTDTFRFISSYYPQVLTPFAYDLTLSLFPIIPNLSYKNQKNLIIMFLNIFTENDTDKLETIKTNLLRYCSSSIESSSIENVKIAISDISNLFRDYSPKDNRLFIHTFMCSLLPFVFHEFTPVASIKDIKIQDALSNLIYQAADSKCIVFPVTEDEDERRKLLIEGDMYGEIFQWLFTMMTNYLCDGHFIVLRIFKIKPFPEVLNIISQIELNEHSETIKEMLYYVRDTCDKNSEKIFSIIPLEYFLNFFNSENVISQILTFLREINIKSNEIKSLIMQGIISKMVTKLWYDNNNVLKESIITIASLVSGSKEVFEMYIHLMTSFFNQLDPNRPYFIELWKLSNTKQVDLEKKKNQGPFNNVLGDLKNIIFSNLTQS